MRADAWRGMSVCYRRRQQTGRRGYVQNVCTFYYIVVTVPFAYGQGGQAGDQCTVWNKVGQMSSDVQTSEKSSSSMPCRIKQLRMRCSFGQDICGGQLWTSGLIVRSELSSRNGDLPNCVLKSCRDEVRIAEHGQGRTPGGRGIFHCSIPIMCTVLHAGTAHGHLSP